MDNLSLYISVITLIVTIFIPIQIMKFQRYTSLTATYMNFDFAHAFQSVINFFHDDCKCDVEMIPRKYAERFNEDFGKLKDEKFEKDNTLHYQRRLLNDYFLELEMCRESSLYLRRIIRKDWTVSEAYVCKILIFMNKAVDDNPEIFKDISTIKHERISKVKGLNKYLSRLCCDLKNVSENMQV